MERSFGVTGEDGGRNGSHGADGEAGQGVQPAAGPPTRRPLAGRKGWLITDGKVGMDVQCQGVAEALGLDYAFRHVDPRGLRRTLAPYIGPSPREAIGRDGSQFAPPWPAIAIATGRLAIPYIRRIARLAGPDLYTVVLQDPKTGPGTADLIWVPEHDRRRGANVITTLTAPHGFSPARLAALRAERPDWLAGLSSPRVAVVLGGKNAVYKFTGADDDRFQASLRALADLGVSFMVTPSRRTHSRLLRAAEAATEGRPRFIWDGRGANPYPHFLAHSDVLVVTADSVNMTGEACATGRPVYVFAPSAGSPKFDRFHAALRRHGATRPLPSTLAALESWSYAPLDSARDIAAEIERRWLARQRHLPRGWPGKGS